MSQPVNSNDGLILFNLLIGSLSVTTMPGQNEPGSHGNEGILHVSQKLQNYWSITIRLFSVISRTLVVVVVVGGGSYPSAEVQSVYSTAPADWASTISSILLKYK